MTPGEVILDMLSDGLAVESMALQAACDLTDWRFRKTIIALRESGKIDIVPGRRGHSKFSYQLSVPKNPFDIDTLVVYAFKNCFKRKLLPGEHV